MSPMSSCRSGAGSVRITSLKGSAGVTGSATVEFDVSTLSKTIVGDSSASIVKSTKKQLNQ